MVDNVVIYENITVPITGKVCNTLYLNVYDYIENKLTYLAGVFGQPITLKSAETVTILNSLRIDNNVFYIIDFTFNGVQRTGYVLASYIDVDNSIMITPTIAPTLTPTQIPISADFETQLTNEGFPESYKSALRNLHAIYPNWVFKAYNTGLDWSTAIANESKPARNLLPNSKGVEWKSLENGAYDWDTDTFTVYDGTYWVTASQAAIEYYMDPRNFLNTSGIFQFELLKYQSDYQNVSGVQKILKGTALYNTTYSYTDDDGKAQTISYEKTFLNAAAYSGVSPYHLASRVKQEVVTGSTTLSGSVTGVYPGYAGYYNFFNIGANDSAGGGAVANGLNFAKNGNATTSKDLKYLIPWTNPFRSILGGSYYIGSGYINRGQDTIYLQKFNVTSTSTYYHQYMTNVEAPYAEGKKVLTAYSGMLEDTPIVFSIPIYNNMPTTSAPYPSAMYNPNNRMKSLSVSTLADEKLTLTPSFSQTQYSYDLIVDNSVEAVKITAKAVSTKATVSGAGTVVLNVGTNTIVISVIAENGDIANYTVTIVRS